MFVLYSWTSKIGVVCESATGSFVIVKMQGPFKNLLAHMNKCAPCPPGASSGTGAASGAAGAPIEATVYSIYLDGVFEIMGSAIS